MVRDLGLFDVIGHRKSVPGRYMRGAVTDRVALLQGLIDTDGHVNRAPGTGVTFSSTSETLDAARSFASSPLSGLSPDSTW